MKDRASLYLFIMLFANFIYSSEHSRSNDDPGFWGEVKPLGYKNILYIHEDHHPYFLEGIKDLAETDHQNGTNRLYRELCRVIISQEPELKRLIVNQRLFISEKFFSLLSRAYYGEIRELQKTSQSLSQPQAVSNVLNLVPVRLVLVNGVVNHILDPKPGLPIPSMQLLTQVTPQVRNGQIFMVPVANSNNLLQPSKN